MRGFRGKGRIRLRFFASIFRLTYVAGNYSVTRHMKNQDAEAYLPLTAPVFHVLLALADGEKHGYAILKEVEERTEGKVQLSTGTLYAIIKRLLNDGLIREIDERPDEDDERRRYYGLTEFGKQVAVAEAERMEDLLRAARAKKLLRKPRHA
jgi:DNA-binding PadR family transcriptional regulator